VYENKFLIGRNFEKLSDTIYTIINKTAMLSMGFNTPQEAINKDIRLAGIDTLKILVIINDFHQTSLAKPIVSMAFIFKDWECKMISIKLDITINRDLINKAESEFQKHFLGTPFVYYKVANNVKASYKNEQTLLRLVIIFSGLVIFFAVLGLIGLVVFYIQKKKKEISIRKVLGSSSKNL